MIPYDDLVVALQTWRARQGLPVAQLSGVAITPPPAPAPIPKSNPPAPPRAAAVAATPPPLAPAPDTKDEEFDEGALLEEAHYENEGDDFAMAFQPPPPAETEEESTSIGSAPGVRDSFGGGGTEPEKGGNRNDDW